jgi:hypothetical protein
MLLHNAFATKNILRGDTPWSASRVAMPLNAFAFVRVVHA